MIPFMSRLTYAPFALRLNLRWPVALAGLRQQVKLGQVWSCTNWLVPLYIVPMTLLPSLATDHVKLARTSQVELVLQALCHVRQVVVVSLFVVIVWL